MTTDLVSCLRTLAEALPTGTAVPVPREALLELLDGTGMRVHGPTEPADATVQVIAVRYGRAASTIRGWCEAGRFPGAYRLHGREWRVPAAALETFDSDTRRSKDSDPSRRMTFNLDAWRMAR